MIRLVRKFFNKRFFSKIIYNVLLRKTCSRKIMRPKQYSQLRENKTNVRFVQQNDQVET